MEGSHSMETPQTPSPVPVSPVSRPPPSGRLTGGWCPEGGRHRCRAGGGSTSPAGGPTPKSPSGVGGHPSCFCGFQNLRLSASRKEAVVVWESEATQKVSPKPSRSPRPPHSSPSPTQGPVALLECT